MFCSQQFVMDLFPKSGQDFEDIFGVISTGQLLAYQSWDYRPGEDPELELEMRLEGFVFNKQPSVDQEDILTEEHTPTSDVNDSKRLPKPRYEKNICGYILKKVLRAFISPCYRNVVQDSCSKYGASFQKAIIYCLEWIQRVNGLSHLQMVLIPTRSDQIEFKQALTDFMEWFLREKYVRHLISDGRMKKKDTYILFKNKFFPREIQLCKRRTREFIRSG